MDDLSLLGYWRLLGPIARLLFFYVGVILLTVLIRIITALLLDGNFAALATFIEKAAISIMMLTTLHAAVLFSYGISTIQWFGRPMVIRQLLFVARTSSVALAIAVPMYMVGWIISARLKPSAKA